MHDCFDLGNRNDEGRMLLKFVITHDMVVFFFINMEVHLIIFQSVGHYIQIDYLLVHKRGQWTCINCKVFLDEPCASQHQLFFLVF